MREGLSILYTRFLVNRGFLAKSIIFGTKQHPSCEKVHIGTAREEEAAMWLIRRGISPEVLANPVCDKGAVFGLTGRMWRREKRLHPSLRVRSGAGWGRRGESSQGRPENAGE